MKKIVNVLTGLSLMTSMAMADNAVLAKDGLGDFLVAPVYFAKNDICTKVTVFNTNKTNSILAKVAFREQSSSNEVDLPIFLSPGDVWSGTVCQNGNDVVLSSIDDSNHPQIADVLKNGKSLTQQSIKAGHTDVDFTTGYIEIYPIAQFNEKSTKKVEKEILVKRWDTLIKGKTPSKLVTSGVDGYSLSANVAFKTDDKYTTILPMVAFKGTHDKTLRGSAIAYGNDTSPEVLLGTTKKHQILKLLQHKEVDFTYSNRGKDQYIVFTYPFGYIDSQIRKYKVTVRDMSENKEKAETIIFSPTPKPQGAYMKNEVSIVSVEDIITKTKNPAMFVEGQIQIQDITNITDVQLGNKKHASFIATYVTFDKNKENKDEVLNATNIPFK